MTENTTGKFIRPLAPVETDPAPKPLAPDENEPAPDDAGTFPRDYVVKLRDENAKYRQRAQDRDATSLSACTRLWWPLRGVLADPTDLAFDDDLIVDPDKMIAAIDELQAKPHLANRKPSGNIGQGVSGVSDTVSPEWSAQGQRKLRINDERHGLRQRQFTERAQ